MELRTTRRMCRPHRVGWLAMSVAMLTAGTANAATWIDSLWLAFDTSVTTSGAGALKRGQVLRRQYHAAPIAIDFGLPPGVRIAALTADGSALLFAPDHAFDLTGSPATPRDVIRRDDNGAMSIAVAANTLGLPANVRIDALAKSGSDYLFSVDVAANVGALTVRPSDVLRWNGTALSIAYSAQSLGIAAPLNLASLERMPNGNLLLGFDTGGAVQGVVFKAGELLEYAPASGQWQLARAQSRFGVVCAPCRAVDAAVIGNPDIIFRSGVEQEE